MCVRENVNNKTYLYNVNVFRKKERESDKSKGEFEYIDD